MPVPFRSAVTLKRFLAYLPDSSSVILSEQDRRRLAALVAREEVPSRTVPNDPAHAAFLLQIFTVVWSAQPLNIKREQLLLLFRLLVSPRALDGLGRLAPEVFIARVQADTPDPGSMPKQVA